MTAENIEIKKGITLPKQLVDDKKGTKRKQEIKEIFQHILPHFFFTALDLKKKTNIRTSKFVKLVFYSQSYVFNNKFFVYAYNYQGVEIFKT